MAEKNGEGQAGSACGCVTDPVVPRMMDQTAARYNDRASFSNNAAMDNVNMLQANFAVQAQKQLESDPGDRLASMLAQLAGVISGMPHGNVPRPATIP